MGFDPVGWIEEKGKKFVNSAGETIKDPGRALGAYLGFATGGGAYGGAAGSGIGKNMGAQDPKFAMSPGLSRAQRELIRQQQQAYKEFNPVQHIEGESSSLRQKLAQDVQESQRNLRGQAQSAGMLHSGRRQKLESDTATSGEQQFNKAREDLVRGTLAKLQQLEIAPIITKLGLNQAMANVNSQAQQISQATDAARAQLLSGGFELIGRGAGRHFGGREGDDIYANAGSASRQQFAYQPMTYYDPYDTRNFRGN